MYAIITTDEYKELIKAQQDGENYADAFHECLEELKQTQLKLEGLLNCITSGKNPKWDGAYNSYELADNSTIADYINKNFVKDGTLTVKGNDNND